MRGPNDAKGRKAAAPGEIDMPLQVCEWAARETVDDVDGLGSCDAERRASVLDAQSRFAIANPETAKRLD